MEVKILLKDNLNLLQYRPSGSHAADAKGEMMDQATFLLTRYFDKPWTPDQHLPANAKARDKRPTTANASKQAAARNFSVAFTHVMVSETCRARLIVNPSATGRPEKGRRLAMGLCRAQERV